MINNKQSYHIIGQYELTKSRHNTDQQFPRPLLSQKRKSTALHHITTVKITFHNQAAKTKNMYTMQNSLNFLNPGQQKKCSK